MKDSGVAKQILGMRIIRDKANGTLKLSQSEYVKKVLSKFNMNEAKPVSTPLGSHFKLSKEQSPKTEEERNHMSKLAYASSIDSRKSTTWFVFTLGGINISWASNLQKIVTLSTTETEYHLLGR